MQVPGAVSAAHCGDAAAALRGPGVETSRGEHDLTLPAMFTGRFALIWHFMADRPKLSSTLRHQFATALKAVVDRRGRRHAVRMMSGSCAGLIHQTKTGILTGVQGFLGAGAHTDWGVVTLLATCGEPGLQVSRSASAVLTSRTNPTEPLYSSTA